MGFIVGGDAESERIFNEWHAFGQALTAWSYMTPEKGVVQNQLEIKDEGVKKWRERIVARREQLENMLEQYDALVGDTLGYLMHQKATTEIPFG